MIGDPFALGAVQEITTLVLLTVVVTLVGASGFYAANIETAVENALKPNELRASTLKL